MDTDLIQSLAILITAAVSIYTAYKAGRKQAVEARGLEADVAEQVRQTYDALDRTRQEEIAALRRQALANENQLEARVVAVEGENQSLRAEIKRQTKDRVELEKRVNSLEAENRALKREVERLQRENSSIRERLAAVQRELDERVRISGLDIEAGPGGLSD